MRSTGTESEVRGARTHARSVYALVNTIYCKPLSGAGKVERTPWSARVPLDPLLRPAIKAPVMVGAALASFLLCAVSVQAATFGKVVPLLGGSADIVLDEARNQLYLTSSTENYVQVYSIARQAFLTPIPTDTTPLSAAISRSGTTLYVACYNSQVLDVISLSTLTVTSRITLPAKPEGVAVGSNEQVLISTAGSGNATTPDLLLLYTPSTSAISSISVPLSTPAAPTFPPPSGRPFLSSHSQLRATRDGSVIAGVSAPSTGAASLFRLPSGVGYRTAGADRHRKFNHTGDFRRRRAHRVRRESVRCRDAGGAGAAKFG